MRRFWRRSAETRRLEESLRVGRPRPRPEYTERLLRRVVGQRAALPRRERRTRPAIAVLVALVALVAFASFGGIGYAKSSGTDALNRAARSVGKIVDVDSSPKPAKLRKAKGKKAGGNAAFKQFLTLRTLIRAAEDQYDDDVLICHGAPADDPNQYITLKLPPSAAAAHLREHAGDYEGPCEEDDD